VLYFPYVVGVKPYSRSLQVTDRTIEAVSAWFITEVPERTLYNWQSAAAKLLSQDLFEQLKIALS
jgi:hypothetical protein